MSDKLVRPKHLITQFSSAYFSSDTVLRHTNFLGVRESDCNTNQIKTRGGEEIYRRFRKSIKKVSHDEISVKFTFQIRRSSGRIKRRRMKYTENTEKHEKCSVMVFAVSRLLAPVQNGRNYLQLLHNKKENGKFLIISLAQQQQQQRSSDSSTCEMK
jgi:hypothetical protein